MKMTNFSNVYPSQNPYQSCVTVYRDRRQTVSWQSYDLHRWNSPVSNATPSDTRLTRAIIAIVERHSSFGAHVDPLLFPILPIKTIKKIIEEHSRSSNQCPGYNIRRIPTACLTAVMFEIGVSSGWVDPFICTQMC